MWCLCLQTGIFCSNQLICFLRPWHICDCMFRSVFWRIMALHIITNSHILEIFVAEVWWSSTSKNRFLICIHFPDSYRRGPCWTLCSTPWTLQLTLYITAECRLQDYCTCWCQRRWRVMALQNWGHCWVAGVCEWCIRENMEHVIFMDIASCTALVPYL